MSFWAELRRHNVFKVGVAYAVLAWLIIQVANNLFPPLGLALGQEAIQLLPSAAQRFTMT